MILEHRTYTFKPGTVDKWMKKYDAEGLAIQKRHLNRFVGVYVGGALINFAVYSVVVWTGPPHVLLPGIGIAIGQAVAIFWNYFGARRLVFRHQSR